MKKFVANIFFFLLFTAVFYFIALFIWGGMAPSMLSPNLNYRIGSSGHMHTRLTEAKTYGDTDILILGSSHAYRAFDTRIFQKNGYKAFNLGSSNQTPTQAKVLLQRHLKDLTPETIIYEVYPNIFTIDGVESSVDVIANDKNDVHSLKMAFETNSIKTYNTLVYGFTRDFLGLNKDFSEPTTKGDDTYISGGFVEKAMSFYRPKRLENTMLSMLDVQLESFSEIVSLAERNGIELLLVYAPITKDYYNSLTNTTAFDSLMQRNGSYYNFNVSNSLIDSLHFYDVDHLNQSGVEIFNNELIDILKK